MAADDYSEVAKFISQNANKKNKFKIVFIKCERPSVPAGIVILQTTVVI